MEPLTEEARVVREAEIFWMRWATRRRRSFFSWTRGESAGRDIFSRMP
jgi:hypothetical protein